MVSEDNLDSLRERKAAYIVGTPKGPKDNFSTSMTGRRFSPASKSNWSRTPIYRGKNNTSSLAASIDRAEKESAMLAQSKARLQAKLEQIDASLQKRPAKLGTIERRIGRWMGRYSRAERFYQVTIRTAEIAKPATGSKRAAPTQTMAVGLDITEKEVPLTWAELSAGAYLLRTNCTDKDPSQLWTWYVQLTQAEECFRISKSDLHLSPVFHQKTERVDAHILVCFLTLAMWRVLEMWMKSKGLGNCARQLIKEIATVRMMDVVLPVRDQRELNLRVVSKPDEQVAQLLARLGLELPTAPKMISNVVAKNQ